MKSISNGYRHRGINEKVENKTRLSSLTGLFSRLEEQGHAWLHAHSEHRFPAPAS